MARSGSPGTPPPLVKPAPTSLEDAYDNLLQEADEPTRLLVTVAEGMMLTIKDKVKVSINLSFSVFFDAFCKSDRPRGLVDGDTAWERDWRERDPAADEWHNVYVAGLDNLGLPKAKNLTKPIRICWEKGSWSESTATHRVIFGAANLGGPGLGRPNPRRPCAGGSICLVLKDALFERGGKFCQRHSYVITDYLRFAPDLDTPLMPPLSRCYPASYVSALKRPTDLCKSQWSDLRTLLALKILLAARHQSPTIRRRLVTMGDSRLAIEQLTLASLGSYHDDEYIEALMCPPYGYPHDVNDTGHRIELADVEEVRVDISNLQRELANPDQPMYADRFPPAAIKGALSHIWDAFHHAQAKGQLHFYENRATLLGGRLLDPFDAGIKEWMIT